MIEAAFIITACSIKEPSKCHNWKAKEKGAELEKCYLDAPELLLQWKHKYGKEWKIIAFKCSEVDEEEI